MLLQKPDLLLLDEPTNHLDLFAVEWLEQFLKEYNGTVMVISHDRYFLDEVVTKIFDLEDGEIHVYHTNYSRFVEEKEERLLQEFQAYQEQQKKIKKMKEAIKRLREWANQANPPNEGLHKRARSMERALERMEKLKKPILERKQMGLQFEGQERSGKDVVVMKEVSKGFAEHLLFNEANLHVRFQERAAIVGRNGTGKTTLLKLLLEQIEPDAGEIRIGSSVKIGYLSQHAYGNRKSNVLEAFREYVAVTEGEARHILAKFLFYGPAVFKKVTQLSGGEKMRLRLAQLMYQDINFLILDEPTNGLDPAGIRQIRDYLQRLAKEENIAVIVSSHLLSEIELMCDRVVIIKQGEFVQEYNLHEQAKHDETVVVAFEVDQVQKANEIVQGKAQGNVIVVSVTKEEIPQLVKKLVNNDVLVYGVTVQNKTLEDEFLAITGGVKA